MLKKLSQIAPVWASRLKEEKELNNLEQLEFESWNGCIVGEAWRYSNEYVQVCNECRGYAIEFVDYHHPKEIRKSSLDGFVDHFNKEHLP